MEWLIIFGAAMLAFLLGLAYLTVCVGRFAFIQKLSGGSKWRRGAISLVVLAAAFALLTLCMSPINAGIVFLHVVIFFLLFGLVMRLVRRLTKKESRIYWQGLLALGVSVLYLTVGYVLCHHVWQKDYTLQTDKQLGTLKVALLADSHLSTTFDGEGFARHLQTIEAQSPDMLVIAGDFVDDGSKRGDLLRACEALGEMQLPYGVWYAYGNHDEGYFGNRDFTAAELEEALLRNGVHILADQYEAVDDRLIVAGRLDSSLGPRKDMASLLAGADTSKYILILDHEPNDYANEANSPADLVLSGHTHGGQLIPITYVGKWFGLLDRVYGYERRQGTDFIVTSGISDWEILFKTGTRSEYVMITIEGK